MVRRAVRPSHAAAVTAMLMMGWAVGALVGVAIPVGAGTCDVEPAYFGGSGNNIKYDENVKGRDPHQGDIIRLRRVLAGWSQERLAEEASRFGPEIKRITISKIEAGQRSDTRPLPEFMEAVQIARALDCSLGNLGFARTDYPELELLADESLAPVLETPS